MPTNASSSFEQLRYIPEATYGVIPGAGNAVNLRMTDPTLKAAIPTVESQEVRPDRLSTGLVRVDQNITGGFNFELSGKEYDPFFEGLLGQSFAHYGTSGVGTTFAMSTTSSTITAAVAPTTTSAFTNLTAGSWFKVIPPAGASQAVKDYFADTWFKVHASTPVTTTVITLDASTPIAAPGLISSTAGYAISQSVIQNGSTVKSFAMELAYTDVVQFLTYTGLRVNSMDLAIDVGSLITGSFDFLGAGHSAQGVTLLPGTPVASQTLDPMNAVTDVGSIYENGSSLLASTSFIKSVKLNVSNNLRGQKAVGVFGNAGVGVGELMLTGTMEVYFQDATYYNKWLKGTNTSLSIGVADGLGNGYLVDFDKVTFKDGALNGGKRNEDVILALPFQAFYNPTTGRGIRITRGVSS